MRLTAALGWIVLLSLLSGCMSTGQAPSQPYGSPRALPISDAAALEADGAALASPAARTAWRDLRESIGVLGFFRPAIF